MNPYREGGAILPACVTCGSPTRRICPRCAAPWCEEHLGKCCRTCETEWDAILEREKRRGSLRERAANVCMALVAYPLVPLLFVGTVIDLVTGTDRVGDALGKVEAALRGGVTRDRLARLRQKFLADRSRRSPPPAVSSRPPKIPQDRS